MVNIGMWCRTGGTEKWLETPEFQVFLLSVGFVGIRTEEEQNRFAENDNERIDISGCTFE